MLNQTALITGASSGIGYELAKVFAREQFNLVLVARREKRLEKLKRELEERYRIKAIVIEKDLSKVNSAQEIYHHICDIGISVDILVNNAGIGDHASFLDSEWDKQVYMIELNIKSLMQMTYLFGNEMRKKGYGRILNLSSVAAFAAGPYMSIYYASKAFVLSFSEAIAEELKGTGVTVTSLCPGPTSTNFDEVAEMKNSHMFTFSKPATAQSVAEMGYEAVMKGKVVAYHGKVTKLMNIGARLMPRYRARNIAMSINGNPTKNKPRL